MWFLSYLREGLSTASNTDIQRAARRRKKADTEDENASTQLPLPSHLFIKTSAGEHLRARVYAQVSAHTFKCKCSSINAAGQGKGAAGPGL